MMRPLALLLVATPALAARTQEPASMEALTDRATDVVRGTVVATRTVERGYEVRTTYTVRPTHTLKGQVERSLAITLPGGWIDGTQVQATGVPVWATGAEVLVFLVDGKPQSLDGLFTVDEGALIDPLSRPAAIAPLTIDAAAERISDAVRGASHNSTGG
ncbi:MAG: hypothetical protein AB8H79_10845 [Myxococcota bacterium]